VLGLGWGCDTPSSSAHCAGGRTLLPHPSMWTIYEEMLSTSGRCPCQQSDLCLHVFDAKWGTGGETTSNNTTSWQPSLGCAEAGRSVCPSVRPSCSGQHCPVESTPAAFLPGERLAFAGTPMHTGRCPSSAATNTDSELKWVHLKLQFCAEVRVTLLG